MGHPGILFFFLRSFADKFFSPYSPSFAFFAD